MNENAITLVHIYDGKTLGVGASKRNLWEFHSNWHIIRSNAQWIVSMIRKEWATLTLNICLMLCIQIHLYSTKHWLLPLYTPHRCYLHKLTVNHKNTSPLIRFCFDDSFFFFSLLFNLKLGRRYIDISIRISPFHIYFLCSSSLFNWGLKLQIVQNDLMVEYRESNLTAMMMQIM